MGILGFKLWLTLMFFPSSRFEAHALGDGITEKVSMMRSGYLSCCRTKSKCKKQREIPTSQTTYPFWHVAGGVF